MTWMGHNECMVAIALVITMKRRHAIGLKTWHEKD
jgi:hypothetical protein